MKVSVEKLPTSEAVLEVDLTWDELENASNKAYRKLVQKVDVQGFRRGKAPRSVLERKLGKEYIYQEGLDELINETYRNALKEYELTPITQPELEAPVLEIGQPYHFSLKVPIITPVELGDYRSLHFDREEVSVTSEEVENELETLRNRQVTWQEVDRPANYDDRVVADLKLTIDDKTISDLKDNTFELTTERHGLFIGMDEHIVGMRAGESKDFTTTLPTDYSNEKLAGKEAHYAVTVYKVEAKEIPELDDALAAKVSNSQFETLEDLRKAISDTLLEEKKRKARDELHNKVINGVIEQSKITLHPTLIQEETEQMMHQFSHLLERQRMSLDQYLLMMRKTRAEYEKEMEPEAEHRVKRQMVLDEVAKKEEMSVGPEEIEAVFRSYAEAGEPLEASEAQIRALIFGYRREKAMARLVELTTDPDPDAEIIEAEANIANAETAALAGEALAATNEAETGATEELVTPLPDETHAEPTGQVQTTAPGEPDNAETRAH